MRENWPTTEEEHNNKNIELRQKITNGKLWNLKR